MALDRRITKKIPKYQLEVKLFGDWEKTRLLFRGIDKAIATGASKGQESASRKLLTIVKRNIRENGGSIGWPPVSSYYAKIKSSKGYDPNNLLVMTRLYYRSINIWSSRGNYYVGVKKRLKHPGTKGKLTVGEIATVLEYGSDARKIQARPLWGPSFKQLGGTRRIKGLIIWHVRAEIYRRFGVRAKVNFI